MPLSLFERMADTLLAVGCPDEIVYRLIKNTLMEKMKQEKDLQVDKFAPWYFSNLQ